MHTHDHPVPQSRAPLSHDEDKRPGRWLLAAFVAIGALLLVVEHRTHVLGVLPWLFLLACPLMHLFMHHGHGSHHGGRRDRDAESGQ